VSRLDDPGEFSALNSLLGPILRGHHPSSPFAPPRDGDASPAFDAAARFDREAYLLLRGFKRVMLKERIATAKVAPLTLALEGARLAVAHARVSASEADVVCGRDRREVDDVAALLPLVRARTSAPSRRRELNARLGRLFGYPDCCIDFFASFADAGDHALWMRRSHTASTSGIDPLLIHFPTAFLSHLPCHFGCAPSRALAEVALEGLRLHLGAALQEILAAQARPLLLWDVQHWVQFDGALLAYRRIQAGPGTEEWFRVVVQALEQGSAARLEDHGVTVQGGNGACRWFPAVRWPAPMLLEPAATGPRARPLRVLLLMLAPGREDFFGADFLEALGGTLHDAGIPCRLAEVPVGLELQGAIAAVETAVARAGGQESVLVFDRPPPRPLVEAIRRVTPMSRLFALTTEPSHDDCGLDAVFPCTDFGSAAEAIDALGRGPEGGSDGGSRPREVPPARASGAMLASAHAGESEPMAGAFPRARPLLARELSPASGTHRSRRKLVWHDPSCPRGEGPGAPRCTFCGGSRLIRAVPTTARPWDSLVDQCEYLQEQQPDLREVIVFDLRLLSYLERLVACLARLRPLDLLLQARVDTLLERQGALARAVDALPEGFRLHLYLVGFESFSAEELERYGKQVTPQQNALAIESLDGLQAARPDRFLFRARGAHGFILFNPWTTRRTLRENLPYLRRYRFHEIRHDYLGTRLRLMPGLPLYERAWAEQLFDDAAQEATAIQAFFRGYAVPRAWRFADPTVEPVWRQIQEALPESPSGTEADLLEQILDAPERRVFDAPRGPDAAALAYDPRSRAMRPEPGARSRALLIQPPMALDMDRGALPDHYVGIGILVCQAFLEEHGVTTTVLHLGGVRGREARLQCLREHLGHRPDVVAIGMNWVHLSAGAVEIALAARAEGFRGPIVVGGQHASMFAEALSTRYSHCFDAVLVGEAEGALLEIVRQGLPADRSAGRAPIIVPSSLGPSFEQRPLISYAKVVPRVTGRLGALSTVAGSCSKDCSYCLESKAARRCFVSPFAARPLEAMVQQMERFVAEGQDIITIQDPFFRLGDDALMALCEEVRRRDLTLEELNVFVEPGAYSHRALEALARFPARRVTVDFGLESGARDVLRSAGRPSDLEAILADLEVATRLGLLAYSWWMLGLPGETPDTVRSTAAYVRRTMQAGVVPRWVTPLLVFPDAPIGRDPASFGVTLRKTEFEDFLPFSHVRHSPFGIYPQLITHDCEHLRGLDVLRQTLALKAFIRSHPSDLELAARRCRGVAEALTRRTEMLTDTPFRGHDMGTFF
jgi:anaerobic magnesium-protoporphyrin IX monomethyl ester cyclase